MWFLSQKEGICSSLTDTDLFSVYYSLFSVLMTMLTHCPFLLKTVLIYSLTTTRVSVIPHSCQYLIFSNISISASLVCVCNGISVIFFCISLITNEVEYLFICLLAIWGSSFVKSVFKSCAWIVIELPFSYWFIGALHILWIRVFGQLHMLHISSAILGLALSL